MTIPIITLLFLLIVNVRAVVVAQKTNKKARALLDELEARKKAKATVKAWKGYLELLESENKFELCEMIRKHIDGKPDDYWIVPPEGFTLERDPHNPNSFFATYPNSDAK